MRRPWIYIGPLLAVLLAAPTVGGARAEEGEQAQSVVRGILESILLPERADEAREVGVPEDDIRVILEASTRHELPPEDVRILLEETTESVRENGPIDNFGAFVQARMAEGLRGRDLAASIRAEHQSRGKGKGHTKRPGQDDADRPGHAGDDDDEAGSGERGASEKKRNKGGEG